MKHATPTELEAYLADDVTRSAMEAARQVGDETLVCDRWLADTPAKRLIYRELYGDLLDTGGKTRFGCWRWARIVDPDVGGKE